VQDGRTAIDFARERGESMLVEFLTAPLKLKEPAITDLGAATENVLREMTSVEEAVIDRPHTEKAAVGMAAAVERAPAEDKAKPAEEAKADVLSMQQQQQPCTSERGEVARGLGLMTPFEAAGVADDMTIARALAWCIANSATSVEDITSKGKTDEFISALRLKPIQNRKLRAGLVPLGSLASQLSHR
jgi:hypothetical protein